MALGGTIRGKKTTLRLPIEADLETYNRWMADMRVRRAHRVWHEPAMPATWKERFKEIAKEKESILWSIDTDGKLIGFALGHLWTIGNAFDVIHFLIDPAEWRKGYGFDAALALHRYLFDYLDLRLATAELRADNAAGLKIVAKLGYIEFAHGPDFPETLAYVKQGRKVVVLRTFSKAASLAGLRVGYGVADADAIALMNRIRQPFNVNSLAQVAALAALEDDSHTLECVRMIEAGRHYLYDEFNALGVKYVPSRANFILVDVGRSASDIYQKLLHEGVIVRPLTPFGMETALRITVGTPDENRRLIKGLRTVLGAKRP